jgi:hypothetical protein
MSLRLRLGASVIAAIMAGVFSQLFMGDTTFTIIAVLFVGFGFFFTIGQAGHGAGADGGGGDGSGDGGGG